MSFIAFRAAVSRRPPARAFAHHGGWLLALWLLAWTMGVAAVSASEPTREDRIKAAIVYKIGKFIDWPMEAFEDANTPLELCLLGEDAFAEALLDIVGRRVQGRTVAFRVMAATPVSALARCHILYLPRAAAARSASVLRALSGKPVLTISDIPGFARSGGMISLVRSGEHIGFEIDPAAAANAGLAVRAPLLDLAEIVGQ